MTKSNITRVQELYQAFLRGEIPAVMDQLSPDVTWGMIGRAHDVPMAGIRKGHAGVMEFFKLLKETQELSEFKPLSYAANDDMVFVLGHTNWTMNKSGVAGGNDWVHVWTFENGKVISYRGHQDTGLLAEAYHAKPAAKRAVA